ncbi:hypothetical protein KI387_005413, partial [Taxus chinensis]
FSVPVLCCLVCLCLCCLCTVSHACLCIYVIHCCEWNSRWRPDLNNGSGRDC